MFHDRVCVPNVLKLKKRILEEGHMSSLSFHPKATKMYQDLKRLFWWPGMKKDIAEFVYACLVFQKSKIEHQKSSGLMQPLFVPAWKWVVVLNLYIFTIVFTILSLRERVNLCFQHNTYC
ncbi:hypothetical protein MtrunA17_Chr3g0095841 [Medicago truncatula]|uniref:Integrase zinc-binding domain-containing protein n=1 Tax=Medicago truncatula TaxID=3880 RepID=A0A396IQM4_MEDTR|nr:hypothetical protein MtrunA17_Chr3g0095841 [Medicago truncatula]